MLVVHHSPFCLPANASCPATAETFRYLSEDFADQLSGWAACPWEVILSGHDHVPAVHVLQSGVTHPTLDDVETFFPTAQNSRLEIHQDCKYWVQSGACGGPPRDGILDLSWIELAPGQYIQFNRVPYDTQQLKEMIQRQPFGSLLNWERFAEATKKPGAKGKKII